MMSVNPTNRDMSRHAGVSEKRLSSRSRSRWSHDSLSDALTKSLPRPAFEKNIANICMVFDYLSRLSALVLYAFYLIQAGPRFFLCRDAWESEIAYIHLYEALNY